MVNPITKELDDYLESRSGESEEKKKKSKRKAESKYSKVPKIDNEYKTFVFDEEGKKSLFRRFMDWLLKEDSTSESDFEQDALEEAENKITDEINKTEEELEDLELQQETKIKNIFQRLLDKIRKIEDQEIKDEYEVNEEHYDNLTKYKKQLNEDVRSSLKVVDKILMKIPSVELDKLKTTSDYQILEAIMHKYNLR